MARSRIWCCLSLSLVVTAVGCGPTNDAERVGVGEGEVQATDAWSQIAIVQDGSQASKATGALEIPMRNANGQPAFITATTTLFGGIAGSTTLLPVRGTCGVTFISPHFAVTAAHCVVQTNVPDPPNNPLIVRQYDVTNASVLALNAAALIKGTFPNYEPLTTPMQNVAGYQSTAYTCHVVSRCATPIVSNSAAFNCDFAGDVAMLHCDDRASNAQWLPVASSDQGSGAPVEMYWFHELLSPIPLTQPAPGSAATAFDRFAHYSVLNGDSLAAQEANWHYIAGPTNALLPLKSIPFSNGTAHKRINAFGATDLFGCHGTSGSGVLQRNTGTGNLELLGPVHTGGAWANTRICDNPDTLQPGQLGLTYEMNTVTQQLQAQFSRALMFDRLGIVVVHPQPPVSVLTR